MVNIYVVPAVSGSVDEIKAGALRRPMNNWWIDQIAYRTIPIYSFFRRDNAIDLSLLMKCFLEEPSAEHSNYFQHVI